MTADAVQVGIVGALYRYPVKSTAGEGLQHATVGQRGLDHDRTWAAYTADGGIGSGKRTRRFRPVVGLMHWLSTAGHDGVPVLTAPDGAQYQANSPMAAAALSTAFGQPLTLRAETTVAHHDESPVHLLTTSSLAAVSDLVDAAVDVRRFRPNIVIDTGSDSGFVEDAWSGSELLIGNDVVLELRGGMPRCVMVDQEQADVAPAPKLLKTISAAHDMMLGLQAGVRRTGRIAVGDPVMLRTSRVPPTRAGT